MRETSARRIRMNAQNQRSHVTIIYNRFSVIIHRNILAYVTETCAVGPPRPAPPPEHLIDGDPRAGEERLIGGDTGLAAVMARARLVSRSSAPVLLFGETGTGKEIIARAIHEHSPFRSGPFRRVNCGAIAPELIDSELFGHEQGAFTGARDAPQGLVRAGRRRHAVPRRGRRAAARRAGAAAARGAGRRGRPRRRRAAVHVNVRIVAATHRDLPAMVEAQTFREDLYYRLSVFPIVIPPLRDRPTDIRAFAEYFAERAANRFGLRPVPVSDDDVRVLAEYRWPGNVREMAAVMDRAVLIGQGRTLNVAAALGQGTLTDDARHRRRVARRDAGDRHRAARRRHAAAHRGRPRRHARARRRPARRGAPAPDQSPHAARPHAQAEDRLAGIPDTARDRWLITTSSPA